MSGNNKGFGGWSGHHGHHAPPDPALWGVRETDEWQPEAELQTYTKAVENAHYDGEGHLVIAARQRDGAITSARTFPSSVKLLSSV